MYQFCDVVVLCVCSGMILFIHVSYVMSCHMCLFCDYNCDLYMFCILSFVLCLSLHQVLGVYITWCVLRGVYCILGVRCLVCTVFL